MKTFLKFLFILPIALSAQTKLISHKSHSGSDANFAAAFENNLFNINASNLGLPANSVYYRYVLDSVISIENSKTVLIKTKYRDEKDYETKKLQKSILLERQRDTISNSDLFSQIHAKDSIIKILNENSEFAEGAKNTVFIGFDNDAKQLKREKNKKLKKEKREQKGSKNILPIGGKNNTNPPKFYFNTVIFLLGLLTYFLNGKKLRAIQKT